MLQSHLACAAFELPLYPPVVGGFFCAATGRAVSSLLAQRLLGPHPKSPTAGALCYTGLSASPAAEVSLRTIDPERWVAGAGHAAAFIGGMSCRHAGSCSMQHSATSGQRPVRLPAAGVHRAHHTQQGGADRACSPLPAAAGT